MDLRAPSQGAARDRWAALREAADAFAAPGLGVDTSIQRVAQTVADLLGGACVVRVLDAEGTQLVPVAVVHRDATRLAEFQRAFVAGPVPADAGVHARVMRERRPVVIEFGESGPGPTKPEQTAGSPKTAPERFLVAPMRTPHGVVGTLAFTRQDDAQAVSDEDRDLLQEIADRAALTIQHARLLEEERKARARAELSSWALREKVAELQASETRFRAAIDAASFGVLLLSPSWTILETNRFFRDWIGFSGAELASSPLAALVHAADDQLLREQARALAASRERVEVPLRLVNKRRDIAWVTLSAAPARDAAGWPGMIVAHVIPHTAVPAAPEVAIHAGAEELTAIGRALSNPVNLTLLARMTEAPAHARALAHDLGRSEGDIQRKLRALEKAGLIAGAWRHRHGATIREYQLTSRTLALSLDGVS